MRDKIKKYIRYLFKTKDKYIRDTEKRLTLNCIYSDDELSILKEKNDELHRRALLENDFSKMMISDFIKQLKLRYYGRE